MATKADLLIDQGSTFNVDLTLLDENGDGVYMVGYTANSQIRKWYTSVNPAATFTASINTIASVITLSLTPEQTANLVAGRYVYDVEIDDGFEKSRIVEGIITVTPEVTR